MTTPTDQRGFDRQSDLRVGVEPSPWDPEDATLEWVEEADGVFRGGGVKGIALAGALLGFAEHPTQPVKAWKNVAGASAGAIIASYLALGHSAEEMEELLCGMDYQSFQDFPRGGKILGGGYNLARRRGLARGRVFRDWFSEVLEHKTFAEVKDEEGTYRLRLIAVDVSNRDLLVLPDDLRKYRLPGKQGTIDPDEFEIADAARMSMAIPYFFEPIELICDRTNCSSLIVDGGTLSNFPVWLFDVDPRVHGRPPRRPTFGFTLVGGRGVGTGLKRFLKLTPWPVRFGAEIFETAQQAWDRRFVSYSTRVRTVEVSAGDVGTTDFKLDKDRQQQLLANGRQAASAFLDQFDLSQYINTFHAGIGAAAPQPQSSRRNSAAEPKEEGVRVGV
jgi:NTE family protein